MRRLEIRGLSGGYLESRVIDSLDLQVDEGQVVGICGRNGMGKTTLVRLLIGILPVMNGEILYAHQHTLKRINKLKPFKRHQLGIGLMPQEDSVFSSLSVDENLTLVARSNFNDTHLLIQKFPILLERRHVKAGFLSGGEKKILSFVRCMSESSKLLLLDEPSEGVQQENIEIMTTSIRQSKAKGVGFIICEQNIDFLLKIADYLVVLEKGRSIFSRQISKTSREILLSSVAL